MFDLSKKGDITFKDETKFFVTFYDELSDYTNFMFKIGQRQVRIEECDDIFFECLTKVNEKYFKGKNLRDYTELRMILYGYCRIGIYKAISKSIDKQFYINHYPDGQPLGEEQILLLPSLIYHRNYHRAWTEKNRQKVHERANSPKYKAQRKIRDDRRRERIRELSRIWAKKKRLELHK